MLLLQENMKFYNFQLNVEINQQIAIYDLHKPGLFAVQCIPTKRTLFMGAENTLYEISLFFNKLLKGSIRI